MLAVIVTIFESASVVFSLMEVKVNPLFNDGYYTVIRKNWG